MVQPADIYKLYITFGERDWRSLMHYQIMGSIKDTTTTFTNEDYFINRKKIKDEFQQAIRKKLFEISQGAILIVDV